MSELSAEAYNADLGAQLTSELNDTESLTRDELKLAEVAKRVPEGKQIKYVVIKNAYCDDCGNRFDRCDCPVLQ